MILLARHFKLISQLHVGLLHPETHTKKKFCGSIDKEFYKIFLCCLSLSVGSKFHLTQLLRFFVNRVPECTARVCSI